jgi:hypothetical protein
MRCDSAISDSRALLRAAASIMAALLVLGLSAAPAFGQNEEVVAGDDIQYRSVCENLIGSFGVTQNQYANAGATAIGGGGGADTGGGDARAVARIAQEQGVSVAQVNECLNRAAEGPGVKAATIDNPKAGVLEATIPDKVLPFTGGIPLLGLFAVIGLAAIVAGVLVLRAVMSRRS